ncbi:MAG: GntR family transcriptional regulator [Clostridia bacterium]|nr:GntR family transcriptional regulator [Clostridia bacterium]
MQKIRGISSSEWNVNIVLSNKSDKPIYEQVYEQVASQIISGELEANFCLPSIRVIAKEIGISIITVKKAWETLENNEFIYTRAGIGCFVTEYAKKHLDDKKVAIAKERLKKDIPYYKSLGFSIEELIALVKEEYRK